MEPKILINGKEVTDLSELPEPLQSILSDDNNNGIPDIAENPFAMLGKMGDMKGLVNSIPGLMSALPKEFQKNFQAGKVIINGKEYTNFNDIPEGEKAMIKAKFQRMQHLKPSQQQAEAPTADKITSESGSSTQLLSRTATRQTSEIPVMDTPAIQEKQDSNRRTLFILALLAFAGWIIYRYFSG